MKPRIGSMFSGYGGLDLAVAEVTSGETVWVADVCGTPDTKSWPHKTPCKSPCTILAHRFPDAPNLGDVAAVDWSTVGAIDILCAGFPCQDVSTAGKRAGLKDGTRTGLWSEVIRAIVALQPRLVVLENVPGIFTAPASGDVEPCAWCVGDGPDGHLRALDAVLADLAEVGFDAEWIVVPASGVGAAHKRERWFLAAYPQGQRGSSGDLMLPSAVMLLPTPMANEGEKAGQTTRTDGGQQYLTHVVHALLPTPAVNDMGAAYTPEEWDAWTEKMKAAHGNGNGHGKSLSIEAQRLLPTPVTAHTASTAEEWRARRPAGNGGVRDAVGDLRIVTEELPERWGDYAAAIARWETVIGRPAPEPTKVSTKGNPQLSPRFTEWLMGLPEDWITDVPGITRNEALKACGNGVVPQQAAAALRILLARIAVGA